MVELDDRLNSLRTQLEHASLPDFDDVLRRRRRHVHRQAAGAALGLAVIGAAVPVGLHALPGQRGGDTVIAPATSSATTNPTTGPTTAPSTGPSTTATTRPTIAASTAPTSAPSRSKAGSDAYPPLEPVISDCGLPSYSVRPSTVTLTCGDGGIVASHLAWTSWGAMAAQATGTASVRDCTPSCSAGTTSSVPITLFVTSSKASDQGQGATPSGAPVISVFDHATMTFTSNTPPGWSGPPVSDYALDVGPFSPDQLAAATLVATFWDPTIAPAAKVAMVAGGTDLNDLRLVLSTLPPGNRVTVTAARVSGDTATVTWQTRSTAPASTTWSLSRQGGHWLIDAQAWHRTVSHG